MTVKRSGEFCQSARSQTYRITLGAHGTVNTTTGNMNDVKHLCEQRFNGTKTASESAFVNSEPSYKMRMTKRT
jgi:hypothetical protein